MTINEYQKLAMTTLNKQMNKKEILMNGVMGLCGESGEAIDIVKKHVFQGHELDRDHLIEEIGDVAWYIAEIATALDVSMDDVLQGNINKLKARYPEGFDSEKSIYRNENKHSIESGNLIDLHQKNENCIAVEKQETESLVVPHTGTASEPETGVHVEDDADDDKGAKPVAETEADTDEYYASLDEVYRRQILGV